MPHTVFDRSLPCGEIFGSGAPRADESPAPFYVQLGGNFAANGAYLGPAPDSDGLAEVEPIEPESNPSLVIALQEKDITRLLKDKDAKKLLMLPLDKLIALVANSGGPSYSGDNAHRLYAAWLIAADEIANTRLSAAPDA